MHKMSRNAEYILQIIRRNAQKYGYVVANYGLIRATVWFLEWVSTIKGFKSLWVRIPIVTVMVVIALVALIERAISLVVLFVFVHTYSVRRFKIERAPGTRLAVFARTLFGDRVADERIDPAVATMQQEIFDALQNKRKLKALIAGIRGRYSVISHMVRSLPFLSTLEKFVKRLIA